MMCGWEGSPGESDGGGPGDVVSGCEVRRGDGWSFEGGGEVRG